MTTIEQTRARAVVLRHALNATDAAELLDMLGLGDDQPEPAPRICDARPGRRVGTVLAVSAATDARLAEPPAPEPVPEPGPRAPAPAPKPKAKREPAPAGAERSCEDCGIPTVPQTRYRLDPDGYRARGIRLRAGKGLCWRCYRPPKGPKTRTQPRTQPKPQQPAKRVTPAAHELDRWAHALVDANNQLAEARAERDHLAGLLEETAARIDEMQRQVETVLAMADQLAAATAGQDGHVHMYPWPNRRSRPRPCACGHPWPGYNPSGGG